MLKYIIVAFVLVFGFGQSTQAQYSQDPDADYVQINAEGWMFCPVTDHTEVKGFLAYADGVDVSGSNIQLAWYQSENDGTWTYWGWDDTQSDLGGAVWWVRSHLNDSSAFTHDIYLNKTAETVDPSTAVPPLPLVNGMFLDDPQQSIVEQAEDPVAVVDNLASTGWQITPALCSVEVGLSPCQDSRNALQCLLDEMASEVELAYFGSSNRNNGGEIGWPCKCTTTWGTPVPDGTWELKHTYVRQGGYKECHYQRKMKVLRTRTGKHWYCLSCVDNGTYFPADPEKKTTNADPGDPCVPPSS